MLVFDGVLVMLDVRSRKGLTFAAVDGFVLFSFNAWSNSAVFYYKKIAANLREKVGIIFKLGTTLRSTDRKRFPVRIQLLQLNNCHDLRVSR